LAPELFAGGEVTPTTDVYALGVILFEVLTGEQPFRGGPTALAHDHASAPIPSMRTFNPGVPAVLQELVEKAAAKTPEARYGTAEGILLDLKAMRDSLRFGKPLDWSIKQPESAPPPVKRQQPPPPREPGRPSATVVKAKTEPTPQQKPTPPPERFRGEPDVPRWVTAANVSLSILAVLALLAFAGYFFLNWTKPREVVVPSVLGKTETEARNDLAKQHLKLRVGQKAINETYAPDTVYFTSPLAGTRVKEGSTVMVGVSQGPRIIAMPDVVGKSEDKARAVLRDEGLRSIEVAKRRDYSEVAAEGTVAKQDPPARTDIERTRKITLVMSKGPPPEGEAVQDTSDQGSSDAHKWTLHVRVPRSRSGEDVLVQIEFTDDDGKRVVYEEYRASDESFDVTVDGRGESAAATISANGRHIWTRRHIRPDQ
jgi:serine/threonine-protein kinase